MTSADKLLPRRVECILWPRLTRWQWALGADTCVSSCALLWSQIGLSADPTWWADIPHDAGDFGRCYRLLKSVEGMTNPVEAAANAFPFWRPMAYAWPELTVLYEDLLQAAMDAEPEFDPRAPAFHIRCLYKHPAVAEKNQAFESKMGVVTNECRALKEKHAEELAALTQNPDEGPTP